MLGVLLRAIYNHIILIIQLIARGGSTQPKPLNSKTSAAPQSRRSWEPVGWRNSASAAPEVLDKGAFWHPGLENSELLGHAVALVLHIREVTLHLCEQDLPVVDQHLFAVMPECGRFHYGRLGLLGLLVDLVQ